MMLMSVGYESVLEDTPRPYGEIEEATGFWDESMIETGKHATNESSKAQGNKLSTKGEMVETNDKPLLLLRLHIANKINGEYVARPEQLGPSDKWELEYRIDEVEDESKALNLHRDCLNKKRKLVEQTRNEEKKNSSTYFETIRRLSDRGRHWRQGQDAADEAIGQIVYEPHFPTSSEF